MSDSHKEKSSQKSGSLKAYHMMYIQQLKYLPAKDVDTLIEWIEKRLNPKEYALIVHDKEPGKEPHIHCMLSFKNARSLCSVAKKLGEIDGQTGKAKSECIDKWKGEPNNGFAYLIHATTKAQKEGKYQYDPSEVRANFDYPARMIQIKAEIAGAREEHIKEIDTLLDLMYIGELTKKELESQLSGTQYAQYHKKIEDVWSKRLQNMAETWRAEKKAQNAEITTIWIYGTAGTGKTSLAKEYAQKSGEEYYISGSSRDIFQGYSGEHKMILDELRPGSMPYQDLLRITDPHGIENGTMAPSRYYDKALACDLIIVTSPYNPKEFYRAIFGESWRNIDRFGQLERRIALTIKMTETHISKAVYDRQSGMYVDVANSIRQNTYSAQNRPKASKAMVDIYETIFGDAPPIPVVEKEGKVCDCKSQGSNQ